MNRYLLYILFLAIYYNIGAQTTAISKYIQSPVILDGNLTEWDFASWITFRPKDPDWKDSARVATMWNEDYLFFAFQVFNKNLQGIHYLRDQNDLQRDDGVEFLIDPNFSRSKNWESDDIAYHVNILNVILDEKGNTADGKYNRGWNGDIESVVRLTGTLNNPFDKDTSYIVEFAVPWKYIEKLPHVGLKMGIDFCVNDIHDDTGEYIYYDWMGLFRFHNPSGFGTLVLEK